MSAQSRRRFLSSLGLGVGATILNPIARTLVREAHVQVTPSYRALIFTTGTTQETLHAPGASLYSTEKQTLGPNQFEWPEALRPLEAKRNQTLLLDNLHCDFGTGFVSGIQHGLGYGFLSMVLPDGSPQEGGAPRAQTFDQRLADHFSRNAPERSVLIGASEFAYRHGLDEQVNMFARGPNEPLPHVVQASVLYQRLFGTAPPSQGEDGAAAKRAKLTDILHADLARLRRRLGPAERLRLESYEQAFEDFDARRQTSPILSCNASPPPNSGQQATPEAEIDALMAIASLALRCGITNVVGVNVGASNDVHGQHMPHYSFANKVQAHGGAGPADFEEPLTEIWRYNAGLVNRTIDELEATPEGDGTVLDGTLITMLAGRPMKDGRRDHHAYQKPGARTPVLIAGRPPGMRLDGRYIAYDRGSYGMIDFYRTCLDHYGIPSDDFGTEAVHARGSLTELG